MVVALGSSRDTLVNILSLSTVVGSHSLHFSILSDRESASVAELTLPLMWWITKL